jgi:hypothetical protein
MAFPIVFKGVVHGKTIVLDETSFLPDGYRGTWHLIVDPEEALRLSAGSWAHMTDEQVKDFEDSMAELDGQPFKMPEAEPKDS